MCVVERIALASRNAYSLDGVVSEEVSSRWKTLKAAGGREGRWVMWILWGGRCGRVYVVVIVVVVVCWLQWMESFGDV